MEEKEAKIHIDICGQNKKGSALNLTLLSFQYDMTFSYDITDVTLIH